MKSSSPNTTQSNKENEFAVRTGKISASLIQRRFRLGYNRAARIMDQFEEKGIAVAGINEEVERIIHEIERIETILKSAKIIEPQEHLDDVVNLGDTVTIEFDDDDRFTFKLVTSVTNLEEIGETVSLDSPLGKAVYLKLLGDKSSYEVNKNKFNFTIVELENIHEDKNEQEPEL